MIRRVKFTPEEMAYEVPAEIDFPKGIVIRGRDAWRDYLARKRYFARLDNDVRRAFPDDKTVNDALRTLLASQNPALRRRKSA